MEFRRAHAPLAAVLVLAFAAPAGAAISFKQVSSTSLPDGVIMRDVRWAGPSEVYVSTGKRGVTRTRVDTTVGARKVLPGADSGGFPVSGLVAAGTNHLFVASEMGPYGWMPLDGKTRAIGQRALLVITDIDAHGDRAALLGADTGTVQGLARDGAIAWAGSLSKGMADLRPLMKGRSNPGGKDMARCSVLQTGAIRFMPDGSLVVAPGVEPGIYRYNAAGKLMQTWDTRPLGIVDDCAMPDTELHLLARDFNERIKWYASRVILDEILPLSGGPALLLRRVEKGVTKWDVVRLASGAGGKPERVALPVTVPSPRAHVRGDVRGNQLVLLVFDDPLPGQQPVAPPRLVVLSIAGQ
jgi:hypothetical protein